MSWLSSFLHPGRGYDAAQEQLNNYYQQAQGPLNEYMQNLMNPQALYDKWSNGYKESDAAKAMEGIANEHGLDAASSMGLMGSSPALQAIQAGTSGIVANDKQQYMKDLMDKYQLGAGVAGQYGQNAMNMGQNSANMAYGSQNAGGNLFGNLFGAGLGLFGGPLASGFSQYMGWSPKGGYNPSPWYTGGR